MAIKGDAIPRIAPTADHTFFPPAMHANSSTLQTAQARQQAVETSHVPSMTLKNCRALKRTGLGWRVGGRDPSRRRGGLLGVAEAAAPTCGTATYTIYTKALYIKKESRVRPHMMNCCLCCWPQALSETTPWCHLCCRHSKLQQHHTL